MRALLPVQKGLLPLCALTPIVHAPPYAKNGHEQDVGVNSEILAEHFGDEYHLLVDVINSLLIDVSTAVVVSIACFGTYSTIWYEKQECSAIRNRRRNRTRA